MSNITIRKTLVNPIHIYTVLFMLLFFFTVINLSNLSSKLTVILLVIALIFLERKFPFFQDSSLCVTERSVKTPKWTVYYNEIEDVYIVSPLVKLMCLFTDYIDNKQLHSLHSKGIIFRVNKQSYIVDYHSSFAKVFEKKQLQANRIPNSRMLLYLALLAPFALVIVPSFYVEDLQRFSFICVYGFAFLGFVHKEFQAFIASKEMKIKELAIAGLEEHDFNGVVIKKGFIVNETGIFTRNIGKAFDFLLKRYIVVSPTMVRKMPPPVQLYLMYHELGHIKRGHSRFVTLTFVILNSIIDSTAKTPVLI